MTFVVDFFTNHPSPPPSSPYLKKKIQIIKFQKKTKRRPNSEVFEIYNSTNMSTFFLKIIKKQ